VKITYDIFGAHEQREKKWRGKDDKGFTVTALEGGGGADAEVEMFGDDWEVIENDRLEKEEEEANEDKGDDD
jgi:hypothetical protein